MKTMLNSNQVNENTVVLINLSGGGTGANRIAVHESLTLKHLGVDPNQTSVSTPVFPHAELQEIANKAKSGEITASEAVTQTQAAVAKHQKAVDEFKGLGSITLEDQIVAGAVSWLCKNKNFSTKDVAGKPYIKPDELQVSMTFVGSEALFSIVGSSQWGLTIGN